MPAPTSRRVSMGSRGKRGSSRGRRSSKGFVPDEISMDLQNMLSIYELMREEEEKRDEALNSLDINFELIEKCVEAKGLSQKEIRKIIRMVDLTDILTIVRKTPQSRGDDFLDGMANLIYEYYDDVIYPPLIKKYYLWFILSYIRRVDSDSKYRAEFLAMFREISRKIAGDIKQATRDITSFGKGMMRNRNIKSGSRRRKTEEEEDEDVDLNKLKDKLDKSL